MDVDSYLGEIRMFAGNYAPVNWAFCNGALLPISDNQALYALLGISYGGDGRLSFALPDFRGRVPVHKGQGARLTYRDVGDSYGTETVSLTMNQIPEHSHPMQASKYDAIDSDPGGQVLATLINGSEYFYSETIGSRKASFDSAAVEYAGSNIPHNNMMPTVAISFIISLKGAFPPRK